MERCLVTGIGGFVGTVLRKRLQEEGSFEIFGISRPGEIQDPNIIHLDICEHESVESVLKDIQPDLIFHLAAQPFVPRAMKDPWETLEINVKGTLNLLEGSKRLGKNIRFVYISSADVYGNQTGRDLPLKESYLPHPLNPYSASKLSAEAYCQQYALYDSHLHIMIARPFNHIGVGQRKEFVVPNFCEQIVSAIKEKKDSILTGDLSPTRDFLDVRDVVNAYLLLAKYGNSGEVYNICSGEETSIGAVMDKLMKISQWKGKLEKDSTRLRSAETSRLVGDNSKIRSLGWTRSYSLDQSLIEIYNSIATVI